MQCCVGNDRVHIGVTQQLLYGADVTATLQQVGAIQPLRKQGAFTQQDERPSGLPHATRPTAGVAWVPAARRPALSTATLLPKYLPVQGQQ